MQECKKGYMVASSSSSSSFLFSFLILVFSYLLSNVCAQFPQSKLVQPPIFESINGVLSAEIHMVMADYYEDVYPNNLSINSDFSLNSTDIFSGNFKDPNFQNATTVLGGSGGGGNIVRIYFNQYIFNMHL